VYVHSKVLLVDDTLAFIGSSNINDRSMLAETDSEIAVAVCGGELVSTYMNGREFLVSKFVHSLRMRLWQEHLGLLHDGSVDVSDPVADAAFSVVWRGRAARNTLFYEAHFPATARFTKMLSRDGLPVSAAPTAPTGHVVLYSTEYLSERDTLLPGKMSKVALLPVSLFQ
jgi:hypothetical protein